MRARTTFLITGLVSMLMVPGLVWVASGEPATDIQAAPEAGGTEAVGAGAIADPAPAAPARSGPALPAPSPRAEGIAPSSAWVLHGRAVDATRSPLPSARVGLIRSGLPDPEAAAPDTQTRADGTFAFELTATGELAFTLFVCAPAWAPAVREHVTVAEAGVAVDVADIVLVRGGAVAGAVHAGPGAACPDARVTLRPLHGPLLRLPNEILGQLLPGQAAERDGRFAIPGLPAGAYALEVTAPGSQRAELPQVPVRDGETTRLPPLMLFPGHRLGGRVFDPDARPVAGASVQLVAAAPGGDGCAREVHTDKSGTFLLDHLPPGPHHLRVDRPGLLAWVRRDLDPRVTHELEVRLERGGALRGRVSDAASGHALARFLVRIQRTDDPREQSAGVATAPRQRQAARLAAMAAELQRAGSDPAELHATLRSLAELETQRRAAQRAAWPFGKEPGRAWHATPDRPGADAGTFAFTGLEDGLWAVDVECPGRPPIRVGPVLVRASAGPTELDAPVPAR